MSPLLFVILLGLLAGFVLFIIVTGVGALISRLLHRRRERRFTGSQEPAVSAEFDAVLTGEQPALTQAAPAQSVEPPQPAAKAEVAQENVRPRHKLGFPRRAARAQETAGTAVEPEQSPDEISVSESAPEQDEQLAKAAASLDAGRTRVVNRRERNRAQAEPAVSAPEPTAAATGPEPEVEAESNEPAEQPEPEHKVRNLLAPLFPHRAAPESPAEAPTESPAAEAEVAQVAPAEQAPMPAEPMQALTTDEAQVVPEPATAEPAQVAESQRRPGLFPARRLQPAAETEPAEPEAKAAEAADPFAAVMAALNKR